MEELEIYLKDKNLTFEEVAIVNELVQFLNSEEVSINNLAAIEEKIELVKYKLNLVFASLLYRKINLITKESELNSLLSFLFTEFKTYEDFSKKVDISIEELKKFVARSYGLAFQNSDTYLKIQEKLLFLEEKEREFRSRKLKLYDEFLWVYLNSRYYTSFIKKMTGISPSEFLKAIEYEDLKENYPENISEIIENKIEFLTRLKVSRVSDLVPIRDMEIVKIVRDDLYKVSSRDYKRLEVVLDYLKNYGNVEKMNKNYRHNPVLVYSILDNVLKDGLLNEEVGARIEGYRNIYNYMCSLSVKEKMSLVKSMVINYYECNGNIVKLVESEANPELVLRLLNDDIANAILGDREYDKILKSIKMYSDKEEAIKIIKKIKEPVVIVKDR